MAVALVRADSLYAWKGPSLLITTLRGECSDGHPMSGLYFRETRVLSTFRFEINGERPWLAESVFTSPDRLDFTYVHPEITQPGGGGTGQSGDAVGTDAHGLPERSLDLRLSFRAQPDGLDAVLVVANHSLASVTFQLHCILDADFADIQEAIAMRREQTAAVAASSADHTITFTYEHPQLPYHSEVRGDEWQGADAAARRLTAAVTLGPQEVKSFGVSVRSRPGTVASTGDPEEQQRRLAQWQSRFTRLEVPANREFERVLTRNIRDFGSFPTLDGQPDEWLALQAGMPAYPAFFGRDAVTAGWQAAMVDCGESLDAALTRLGRMQSDRFDDWRDEQPGRIPYQVRSGPLALLNRNPYSAYYADFASPMMYVISLANLYAWTGDKRCVERHWDTTRRILDWARDYGDADHDGYLEYQTRSSKGTKNQGWKDSGDAIIYDDGSAVAAPIATCELQGYWYIAQELMAVLSAVMNAGGDHSAWRSSAAALQQRFNRDWWMPDEQFFAVALDPDKRQ